MDTPMGHASFSMIFFFVCFVCMALYVDTNGYFNPCMLVYLTDYAAADL